MEAGKDGVQYLSKQKDMHSLWITWTYQQGAVDTVDNYVYTEVLHRRFKRAIGGWLIHGVHRHGIVALVASEMRTVLFKQTGWMKLQERNDERNKKARTGEQR